MSILLFISNFTVNLLSELKVFQSSNLFHLSSVQRDISHNILPTNLKLFSTEPLVAYEHLYLLISSMILMIWMTLLFINLDMMAVSASVERCQLINVLLLNDSIF